MEPGVDWVTGAPPHEGHPGRSLCLCYHGLLLRMCVCVCVGGAFLRYFLRILLDFLVTVT